MGKNEILNYLWTGVVFVFVTFLVGLLFGLIFGASATAIISGGPALILTGSVVAILAFILYLIITGFLVHTVAKYTSK